MPLGSKPDSLDAWEREQGNAMKSSRRALASLESDGGGFSRGISDIFLMNSINYAFYMHLLGVALFPIAANE